MSGASRVVNFGEYMKEFPRSAAVRGPIARAPLWIRFRARIVYRFRTERHGPWMYCYWQKPLRDISPFVRAVLIRQMSGQMYEVERLGKTRPDGIAGKPFSEHAGVDLFMEAF